MKLNKTGESTTICTSLRVWRIKKPANLGAHQEAAEESNITHAMHRQKVFSHLKNSTVVDKVSDSYNILSWLHLHRSRIHSSYVHGYIWHVVRRHNICACLPNIFLTLQHRHVRLYKLGAPLCITRRAVMVSSSSLSELPHFEALSLVDTDEVTKKKCN